MPSLGLIPSEFHQYLWQQKTKVPGLFCDVICVILYLTTLVRYRLVTDGRTDRWTDTGPSHNYTALAKRRVSENVADCHSCVQGQHGECDWWHNEKLRYRKQIACQVLHKIYKKLHSKQIYNRRNNMRPLLLFHLIISIPLHYMPITVLLKHTFHSVIFRSTLFFLLSAKCSLTFSTPCCILSYVFHSGSFSRLVTCRDRSNTIWTWKG